MSAQNHSYQHLQANMPAIKELADAMLQAKFFGLANKGAALVVAVELYVTGESPMEYQRRNGFVGGGNPYTPYDAMIAAFQEAGGKVKLISKTPELAAVELTYAGQTTPFSLSWVDAQKETFCYEGKTADILKMMAAGKTPSLKPKYATPRSRAIMLYARMIDDAIRSVAAGVNFGRYTAEVIEDIPASELPASAPEQPGETIAAPPTQRTQTPPSQKPPQQSPPQQTPAQQPPVNNVAQDSQSQPAASTETATTETATAETASSEPASNVAVDAATNDAMTEDVNDPCSDSHRKKILDLIAQFTQQGMPEVKQQVVARLQAASLPNLNALTINEAERLIHALQAKQIGLWIDSQIEGHMIKNQADGNALAETASGNA